jgi:arylsulfatase A-like enzyme
MRQVVVLALGVFLLGQAGLLEAATDHRPAKPNVIIILADDLGWQDVKCYDIDEPSPMETPHLDRLATQGVMFWQAYSPAPVCAPSRAAILSGLHPARGEMTSVAGGFPPHASHPRAELISPFYTARMPVDRYTIAEALKADGYRTGHSGKWHISKNHYDYPKPYRHGFDVSTHERGVQSTMKPDRLTGFATRDPNDPYRLDENGFPFDVPQHAALEFIRSNKNEPFFLYYATWLVHAPIVMRSEALLRKYERKLGVTITEEHKDTWKTPGQTNPFYCAMVEQFDYYVGQVMQLLADTEDPRWPGHTLAENTYVFFTSDNGGMEGSRHEVYTDNEPLDRGKISLKEGGTRVPFMVVGPGIPAGVQSDVLVNGLDIYPTVLSLVGAKRPAGKRFDGCDLSRLLTTDPTDPTLVQDAAGDVRDSMVWHFPQMENSSSIRVGEYKLFRKHASVEPERSLYRLYTGDRQAVRGDIEEQQDLAAEMPEKAAELDARLTAAIREMGGRLHYRNPDNRGLPDVDRVPEVVGHRQEGRRVVVTYRDRGAQVVYADLIYSQNGGREWQRAPGRLVGDDQAILTLPEGTSHYFVNLIDENNFLVIHPPIDRPALAKSKQDFQDVAIFAGYPALRQAAAVPLEQLAEQRLAAGMVLAAHDFEQEGLEGLNQSGKGVAVTQADASAGRQSLKLHEEPGLERPWMPLVSLPVKAPEQSAHEIFRVSFDVQPAAEAPGAIQVTLVGVGKKGTAQAAGMLALSGDGVMANDQLVAPLQPGVWQHVELACSLAATGDRMLTVTVRTADGQAWKAQVPYSSYLFERPTELQVISLGEVGSTVFLDNLIATVGE